MRDRDHGQCFQCGEKPRPVAPAFRRRGKQLRRQFRFGRLLPSCESPRDRFQPPPKGCRGSKTPATERVRSLPVARFRKCPNETLRTKPPTKEARCWSEVHGTCRSPG